MRPVFDPYHKWLGIPPDQQPPDYYRLLAIEPFESDPDVIQAAADQRMAHLRNYQTGPHSDLSQRLLNEVASARVCLLNAAKKAAYDGQLRAKLQEAAEAAQEEYPLEPTAPPLADVLDEMPYARRPRVSLRRTSAGFGRRVPVPAILVGLAIVGGLVVGVMYWNGSLGRLTAPPAEPRNGSAEGSAKIVKSGDNAGAKKAKRGGQATDEKSPIEMSEPPASVAKPAEPASSPSEPSPAKLPTKPDMVSNVPAAEDNVPDVSEHDAAPSLLEVPDKRMRTPPPDNPPPSPSPAETKPAERASAPPASSARLRVRFNKWFDLLSPRNELFDWEVRDGRYSYADRLIELEDGCLFCPIVAKDAMIRATVRRSGNGAFVYLILRNSDEGCYAAGLEDRTVRIFRLKPIAGDPARPLWNRRTRDSLGEFTLPQGNANAATVVFQFGFSAVGNTLATYINTDVPLLMVKDNNFTEGSVGIGVRNSPRGYFTDVELKIPNKAAFVADQRPLPGPAKSTVPSDPKPPAK